MTFLPISSAERIVVKWSIVDPSHAMVGPLTACLPNLDQRLATLQRC